MKLLNELTKEEKRLLVNDILNKEQTGDDWADIVQRHQLSLHPDTIRKAGIGVRLADDVYRSESNENQYMERQKMRDLAAKVNAAYRSESRSELLRETVYEAIKNVKPYNYEASQYRTDPVKKNERQLVVCVGDVHFGADIDCKGLYGQVINRYNEDVFRSRMDCLFVHLIDMIEKEKPECMVLYFVGDLIDGILRQSQLTRLEYGLVQQVIRFSEYMSGWVKNMSQYIPVRVRAVSGNHSEIRPLGSKARQFEEENLEKIIFWYMSARLQDVRGVDIDEHCDRVRIDLVCGYRFMLLHGDGEKKIEDIAKSSINLYGNPIDFFVCGHHHRMSEFPMGVTPDGNSEIIRVPSLCGTDLYAQNKGYGGRAGAVALVIEKGYGCRCKYPIKLG